MIGDQNSDWGAVTVIEPELKQWEAAAYIQIKPYNASRATAIALGGGEEAVIETKGETDRLYRVEVVWKNDEWDVLLSTKDLDEAKTTIQALAARHDVPIRRLAPGRSDVVGY